MSTCTFFGHRNAPDKIEPALRSTLVDLIEDSGVTLLYVGNQGGFDDMVYRLLRELSARYPITVYVVLAYMPETHKKNDITVITDTILPEGIETVPKRFAIDFRNRWMIDRADYVVTYVTNNVSSGAAKFEALAERKGKKVVNIADKKTIRSEIEWAD